ncbi:hypothetical protein H0H92_011548 [Tricholoma furcatifolium]|nr:hypothetical protein H0H92_011548 [Tricholoma furcatifolium]
MSALPPSLPLNILDEIVQLLFFDGDQTVKRTLSACASAGDRELFPRVQRLLFVDIRLETAEDFRILCSLFECNPSLAAYIRMLRIPHATVEEVDAHIPVRTVSLTIFDDDTLTHQQYGGGATRIDDALAEARKNPHFVEFEVRVLTKRPGEGRRGLGMCRWDLLGVFGWVPWRRDWLREDIDVSDLTTPTGTR